MKCYYEILNISREADSAEIKNAYRKLALKWHPDKNPNNPDEAKEQFQAVQNAYEVLSDLQERAWYDSHREQLLRGAGSTFNDESLDLIPFFTPSCYKGFGDDEKGFYAIYKEVFKKLAAEEVDYLDDPEDISNIPMFGKSDSEYEVVHEFYSYWMSFSTAKSFVWLDKYNIREADNRRVLKMLEKENNKIRQKARKERNDEIRQLVAFVRRRDKRVIAHSKLLQEKAEENKRKAEQMRKEKLVKRQQELEEAKKRQSDVSLYSMNDFHEQLDQLEKHLAEEFGHSDEETLTGPSDIEENESLDGQNNVDPDASSINGQSGKEKYYAASQSLYCTACNKLFKNVKSFENHENSKKHKENVANMVLETELDFSDEENSTSSGKFVENPIVDDELQPDLSSSDNEALLKAAALSKKKKKKNKKTLSTFENNDSHVESNANLDDLNDITRSRRARKAKNVEKLIIKTKEDKLLTTIPDVIQSENTVGDVVLEDVTINDVNLSNGTCLVVEDETKGDPIPDDSLKPEKKPVLSKGKEKKFSSKQKIQIANEIDLTTIDTSHCCAICKCEFASKNKLFDHLKKTGHQIFLSNSQAATKVKEKKKGSKNR